MTEEVYATNEIYNLTKQGIPFRDAYKKISKDLIKNRVLAQEINLIKEKIYNTH